MSDYNFIRFFVMLNEQSTGYGTHSAPNGYCKVESLDGKAVFTFSIRNIRSAKNGYRLYATFRDAEKPVFVSQAVPQNDGTFYKSIETDAENVFESGKDVTKTEAIYVLTEENVTVLSGYANRNVTERAKSVADDKLNMLRSEKTFEAASTDMSELSVDGTLPEEIETTPTELEEEAADDTPEKEKDTKTNNIASYISTLTKLYEGLTGAKSTVKEEEDGYRELVGNYYNGLSEKYETSPFPFSTDNTKWIGINGENDVDHSIVGLVWEEGRIKYIANGIPQRRCSATLFGEYAIWFPVKNGKCGITGYWVTFTDAGTGRAVIPDLRIM